MDIIRHNTELGRLYQVNPGTFLPSVTTILSLYQDPELVKFRNDVGEDFFALLGQRGADRGSVMHKYLELFLGFIKDGKSKDESLILTQNQITKEPELEGKNEKAWKTGKKLFYNFWYDEVFNQIDTVLETEIYLYADTSQFKIPGGYAGTSDFVFIDINGFINIADFKSSKKKKDPQHIKTYYMQLAAYMFAYYQRTGKFPEQGQIWISNELDDCVQKIKIHKTEWKEIFKDFLKLLLQWYNINGNNLEKWKQNNP